MADRADARAGRTGNLLAVHMAKQVFDLFFRRVGEFVSFMVKELDAVVLERIVRRGNHHTGVVVFHAGEIGYARCRDHADQIDAHPGRTETGRQRRFDHAPGNAGIPADQEAVRAVSPAEISARRAPHLISKLRHERGIHNAADSVRAK